MVGEEGREVAVNIHHEWLKELFGKQDIWFVMRNDERYGDMAKDLPRQMIVFGTLKEAREMAERLSNWYAGCDYMFYVCGDDD
jgi:hypothetical protein